MTDVWTPNDRLLINLGARVDNFVYKFDDTVSRISGARFLVQRVQQRKLRRAGAGSDIAMERQFVRPVSGGLHTDDGSPASDSQNDVPASTSYWVFSPRLAGTYTLNPDNVLRASAGRYVRAAATSSQEINDRQQDLPDQLSGFYKLGYTTPYHQNLPDSSWNYDVLVGAPFPRN